MRTAIRVLGHPLHPMLIVFPLGLLATSVIFDIIYLSTGNGRWAEVAFWLIAAGVIGGLLAAVFGVIDWVAIPAKTRAKVIGLMHGGSNVVAVLLFAISWFLRRPDPTQGEVLPIVLSFIGLAVALLGGWLGGELVYRLNVSVDEGANVNAPNSLSGRPAGEVAPPRAPRGV